MNHLQQVDGSVGDKVVGGYDNSDVFSGSRIWLSNSEVQFLLCTVASSKGKYINKVSHYSIGVWASEFKVYNYFAWFHLKVE